MHGYRACMTTSQDITTGRRGWKDAVHSEIAAHLQGRRQTCEKRWCNFGIAAHLSGSAQLQLGHHYATHTIGAPAEYITTYF